MMGRRLGHPGETHPRLRRGLSAERERICPIARRVDREMGRRHCLRPMILRQVVMLMTTFQMTWKEEIIGM